MTDDRAHHSDSIETGSRSGVASDAERRQVRRDAGFHRGGVRSANDTPQRPLVSVFYEVGLAYRCEDNSIVIRSSSYDDDPGPRRERPSGELTVQADNSDYDFWVWLVHDAIRANKANQSLPLSEIALGTWVGRRSGINSEEIPRLRDKFNQLVASGVYNAAVGQENLNAIPLIRRPLIWSGWSKEWPSVKYMFLMVVWFLGAILLEASRAGVNSLRRLFRLPIVGEQIQSCSIVDPNDPYFQEARR